MQQYSLLPEDIIQRLGWATSAMHAYGHQWSCQLMYSPRFQRGLGCSEGEGVERTWSKLRIVIPVTRTSSVSRTVRDDFLLMLLNRDLDAFG